MDQLLFFDDAPASFPETYADIEALHKRYIYITVLAGRNSTGKSTVLALLANSAEIKKNVCETYRASPTAIHKRMLIQQNSFPLSSVHLDFHFPFIWLSVKRNTFCGKVIRRQTASAFPKLPLL